MKSLGMILKLQGNRKKKRDASWCRHINVGVFTRIQPPRSALDIKKGHFGFFCEFLPKLDEWLRNGPDQSIPTDSVVTTFSNVNPEVVELNALALEIDGFPQFKSLALGLGRLHDLVALFPDPVMTNSALDRLSHHAHHIMVDEGDSYRKKLSPKTRN